MRRAVERSCRESCTTVKPVSAANLASVGAQKACFPAGLKNGMQCNGMHGIDRKGGGWGALPPTKINREAARECDTESHYRATFLGRAR